MDEGKESYLWVRMNVVRTGCDITLFSNDPQIFGMKIYRASKGSARTSKVK